MTKAAFVLALASLGAVCPPDPQLPSALPAVGCPKLVMPGACHWCPAGDTRLSLFYDEAPDVVAKQWADALRAAGWTIRLATPTAVTAATTGSRLVWLKLGPGGKLKTEVVLNYTP